MKKLVLLLSFCLLYALHAKSQEAKLIEFFFESDTIQVEAGQTFSNFLIITNASKDSITISAILPKEKIPGLLLSPKGNIKLGNGETKRIPFKFIANVDFMKNVTTGIHYSIAYLHGTTTHKDDASFEIKKKEEKTLAFRTVPIQYLDPALPKTKISFFVENRTYSKRSIKINLKASPDGLKIEPNEFYISLEGQENKLIEFDVVARQQRTYSPDFRIEVAAVDQNTSESVGNTTINLAILSSHRQMNPSSNVFNNQNSVEVMYNQTDNNFQYWQLKGNTEFNLSKNVQGRFNTGIDYYSDQKAINLYDTWFELEKNNSVVRLGNIYGDDYDFSVSGRGIKGKWQVNEGNAIELLTVDNNYNLYSTYFNEVESSRLIGTKYNFSTGKNIKGKASYLYESNKRLNTQTHLANILSPFILDSLHKFQTEVGISSEQLISTREHKLGGLLGINYNVNVNDWEINSVNKMSSSYYAGQSRGSWLFNQHVAYLFKNKSRVFLQFQHSKVQPHYLNYNEIQDSVLDSFPTYFYQYQEQILQSGIQVRKNYWNILFSPQIVQQKNLNQLAKNEFFSYRFRSDIGKTFRKHGINLSFEYSYSKDQEKDYWFNGIKTSLNYRFKEFNLNGTFQYNPHDVTDLSRIGSLNEAFKNYSVHSSYSFQAINNTLKGNIAIGINYSELYNTINQNASANMEYKITPSWSATAYGNYFHFKTRGLYNNLGSNAQIRVGIKKHFAAGTNRGNYKVKMQFFNDKNGNGKLDYDEVVLASEQIKLDNFVAITDAKGKVSFQNVPKGTYQLKVNESAGLRLMMEPTIQVDANKNLQIGLIKNNKITGKLVEIKQEYDIQETDVTGILVYAKDKDGTIKSTVVNQNNYFEFFLKNGEYEIFIENNNFQILHPSRNVTLKEDETFEEIIFEYKKKNKEIKVKKF